MFARLLIIFFMHGVLVGTWASRIPAISADLGLGAGALGVVLLAGAVGGVLSLPLAPRILRHVSAARVIGVLAIPVGAITVCKAAAPTPLALAVVLALSGLCLGVVDVAMNATAVRAEQLAGRHVLSRVHAAWSAGGILAAGVAIAAIESGTAPGPHFAAVAVVASAVMLLAATGLPREIPVPDGPVLPGAAAIRRLWPLAAVVLCAQLGEAAAYDWAALFLVEGRGFGASSGAVGLLAIAISMTVTRATGDALSSRFSSRKVLQAGGAIAAAGSALAIVAPNLPTSALGLGLLGAGVALAVPIGFRTAGAVPGMAPATGIAVMASLGYTAFLAGPPLIGGIAEQTSLTTAFWVIAGVLVLVPICTPAAFRAVLSTPSNK